MKIIHVDTDKRTSTVYYEQYNAIYSLEVENDCFKTFFDDANASSPNTATDAEWDKYLKVYSGERDFGYMDFLADNPDLIGKFAPYLSQEDISLIRQMATGEFK